MVTDTMAAPNSGNHRRFGRAIQLLRSKILSSSRNSNAAIGHTRKRCTLAIGARPNASALTTPLMGLPSFFHAKRRSIPNTLSAIASISGIALLAMASTGGVDATSSPAAQAVKESKPKPNARDTVATMPHHNAMICSRWTNRSGFARFATGAR
jgi:hypothetical protein